MNADLQAEWLETNGIGGYASSTVSGMNTRRYHGLLIAATMPPVGRRVLLSKLEETLVVGDQRFELSANQYPGVIHPRGYQYLVDFRRDPHPVYVYEAGGARLEKSVAMVQGENTTIVEYRLLNGPGGCQLEVRPLVACRDHHGLTHRTDTLNLSALHFRHNAESQQETGQWYYNFEYARERERGLDWVEDLFQPFQLTFNLDHPARIRASDRADSSSEADDESYGGDELQRAAFQFIVKRGDGHSVIAGYHWFTDWTRDAMIALPGLTLATNRPDLARSILLNFAAHLDRGMLPNRFPDGGEAPEYNTVDGTLWFFESVRALVEHSGDHAFVREDLWEKMKDIVEWHLRGTRHGIHADADGLLAAGEPGVQLTWMDTPATPRRGKPVEIQALWYNALCVMEGLARQFGEDEKRREYEEIASRARWNFNRQFWNEQAGCLYDVIDGESRDESIRPNQVLAVSLPCSMLDQAKAARIVEVAEQKLLTPYGLRTLAREDPQYRGRYEGDAAYHQGTVWPWLIDPYVTACRRVGRAYDERPIPLRMGQVPEIFDGDEPHEPRGCIAQAWSVAEVLRVYRRRS